MSIAVKNKYILYAVCWGSLLLSWNIIIVKALSLSLTHTNTRACDRDRSSSLIPCREFVNSDWEAFAETRWQAWAQWDILWIMFWCRNGIYIFQVYFLLFSYVCELRQKQINWMICHMIKKYSASVAKII